MIAGDMHLVAAAWTSPLYPPVPGVAPESRLNLAVEILHQREVDVIAIGYCFAEAPPIRDLWRHVNICHSRKFRQAYNIFVAYHLCERLNTIGSLESPDVVK